MKSKMKSLKLLLVIMQCASLAHCTCVFDSDFGFILNCNFKKSGLFRVRNLGGVKAHFGLGFSVGDDLGFAESLGNLEGGRRRALNYRTAGPVNNIGVYPAVNLPVSVNPKPTDYLNIQKNPVSINDRSYQNNNFKSKPLMTGAASLPLGVPAFRPIPYNNKKSRPVAPMQISGNNYRTGSIENSQNSPSSSQKIPVFQALPQSISRTGNTFEVESNDFPISQQTDETAPVDFLLGHSVERLAEAANVSVEAIKQAIYARQQQLLTEYNISQDNNINPQNINQIATQTPIPSSPSTFTTVKLNPNMETPKVMNAPKEYYPIGYEKNFDDNFTTKVDLPTTSFNCANQKHFPGLYADTNLGCMVFHVCALTDDGLIMKSFLCPESTLFDQTILKCNWWFYVDCKNSKNIYDSNIPISKSYQLMKSLTYFSNYNKQNNGDQKTENLDLEALKNTVIEEDSKLT